MSDIQIVKRLGWFMRELQRHAQDHEKAMTNQGFPTWFKPDPQADASPIEDPYSSAEWFDRKELAEKFGQTVSSSGGSSGHVGDLSSIVLQGSLLQAAEAAFRSLHTTFVRAIIHASARMHGHAADNGVIQRAYNGYLQFIVALSKLIDRTPVDAASMTQTCDWSNIDD